MLINTHVVRALMALRGIDEPTLAKIANVTTHMMTKWLHDGSDGDEVIAFDTQLEILRVLGIDGEAPRRDIVHYWRVHQEFFSSKKAYWAIEAMTETFGAAEVVYFAKDTDPVASVNACAHFGLQFQSFKAILEVTTHPLRNIGFDPADYEMLSWAEGSALVLANKEQFEKLAPGLMTPVLYDRQLTLGREQLAWERLNSLSRETKIGPAQLEMLLQNVQQGLLTPQLTAGAPVGVVEPDTAAKVARTPTPPVSRDAVTTSSTEETPAPLAAVSAARDDVPVAPAKSAPAAATESVMAAPAPRKVDSVIDQAAASMGNNFVPRPRRRVGPNARPLRAVPTTGSGAR